MSFRDALRTAPQIEDVPGLRLLKVGDGWDLVRMPAEVGFPALALLRSTGSVIGPVLYDRPGDRLYYAIRTGTGDSWQDLPVRLLSTGAWLVAPSPYWSDDWFGGWCELPDDDALTDPDILRTSLRQPQPGSSNTEVVLNACP